MKSKSDDILVIFRGVVVCVWTIVTMGLITVVVNRSLSYEQLGIGLIIVSMVYVVTLVIDASK